ncbi:blastula protease 10-like [Palaemon carinicauda]|uniref:blastula protease 10-like n=1 Tax=Palaemon carinicauda TaxID=392227 RepID=UPI0035B613A3
MGFPWYLSVLVFTIGRTLGQETTDMPPPLILDDHPENGLLPEENPPMVTPPKVNRSHPLLRREDLSGFENINPTHVNSEELFESDILLNAQQKRHLVEKKAIPYLSNRWKNGPSGTPVVPYKFGDSQVNQAAVKAGLAHWQEHTCIVFQEISGTAPAEYLNFIKSSGCWSYVGMQPTPQDLSIGQGCESLETVTHEVGHAMGFFHEQSRSDRDDYISIIWDNVQDSKKNNFQKHTDNSYSTKYDFNSNMHYGPDYFSTNGKITMSTKNPLAQELIGNSQGLSHYDKLLANTMYPCIAKWMETCDLATNPCQNDGYVGKDCNCVCPNGTSGSNCETVNQSYFDSLLSSCSANITAAGTVTSPNYPDTYPANIKCVKWIQAPASHTVKIKFNSFELYGKDPYCNGNLCCYFDRLEIRTTNLAVGDVYCGTDIAVGTEFTSPSNQMILYFKTVSDYYPGWSIDVTFVPNK